MAHSLQVQAPPLLGLGANLTHILVHIDEVPGAGWCRVSRLCRGRLDHGRYNRMPRVGTCWPAGFFAWVLQIEPDYCKSTIRFCAIANPASLAGIRAHCLSSIRQSFLDRVASSAPSRQISSSVGKFAALTKYVQRHGRARAVFIARFIIAAGSVAFVHVQSSTFLQRDRMKAR